MCSTDWFCSPRWRTSRCVGRWILWRPVRIPPWRDWCWLRLFRPWFGTSNGTLRRSSTRSAGATWISVAHRRCECFSLLFLETNTTQIVLFSATHTNYLPKVMLFFQRLKILVLLMWYNIHKYTFPCTINLVYLAVNRINSVVLNLRDSLFGCPFLHSYGVHWPRKWPRKQPGHQPKTKSWVRWSSTRPLC